ncbi:MAG: hypothetical protein RMA76_09005 [Deltaproteobacteria bacterium]|jgi:hypothetical protein
MSITKTTLGVAVLMGLFVPSARAEDEPTRLTVAAGAAMSKTTWRGDAGAHSTFELGLDPMPWLGFFFLSRLGYGLVDQRMLTYVSVGARFSMELTPGVRAFTRLSLAHQHEETLHVVQESPAGALFGIGDGIRHRGGGELGLGLTFDIAENDGIGVYASVEGNGMFFPDPRGPTVYAAFSSALGLRYAL